MRTNLFDDKIAPLDRGGVFRCLRQAAFGAACLAALVASGEVLAAGPATPAACKALQVCQSNH